MNKKYTNKNIKFLTENYPKYGAPYCAKILNVKKHCIHAFAKRHHIKKEGKYRDKHPSMMAVNVDKFFNITDPEVVYFLGFFWADGNIINYISKDIEYNQIRLEINTDDAVDIMPIIKRIGDWSMRTRKRKNWKEQTIISTNNRPLFKFLKDNDYGIKSCTSPTKILNKIPPDARVYFWRGFFDGDGCISFSTTYRYISFCGSYVQNWSDLKKVLRFLKIQYGVYKSIEKSGNRCSKVTIQNKDGIF